MHTCIDMTRVISLSDEAYGNLAAAKGEGESFSEVVKRLSSLANKKSIADSAGKWAGSNEEADKILKIIEEDRKKFKLSAVKF